MQLTLSFFPNIKTPAGNQEALSWEDAVSYLTSHLVRIAKDGPLYSPALYIGSPQRLDMNVVGMSAVVLDVDNSEGSGKNARCVDSPSLPEDHEDNLGDVAYIWHSTHSNKSDWPKWRLVLPLSRVVSPQEWPAVFAGAVALLGHDPNIDGTCKDLSRSYYLPSCPPDKEACTFAGSNDGSFVDPDYLIELSGMAVDYSSENYSEKYSSTGPKTPGRNNALKAIVAACLERGEALEKIVTEVLVADSKHEPPLFQDPSETQYANMSPEAAGIKFVANVIASTDRNRRSKGLPPEIPHIRHDAAYAAPEPVDIDYSAKPKSTLPIPREMLCVPGLVGKMIMWLEQTAIKPQPILSLAASLAAAGCVMGRKVQTPTGLRTNLLIVGLGETSSGKDHARQKVKEIFVKSGAASMIGAEELASDTGLLTAVAKSPAILFQLDEFGRMLRSINAEGAKGYKAEIPSVIMKLDSSASSTFIGRAYASKDKDREDIHQPNICLYGTTVPGRFFSALTPAEIEDGFIPRLLVFASEDPNPRRQKTHVGNERVPSAIIEQIKWWAEYQGHMKGNLAAFNGGIPEPRILEFSPLAEKLFDGFEDYVRDQMDKLRPKGLAGLWGKVEAQAQRLALIYACSENCEAEEISGDAAQWAIELTMILTHNMVHQAEQHISSNHTEAAVKKILRDIMEAGAEGISRRDLHRKNRTITSNSFRDILKSLSEDGEIFRQDTGKTERWRNIIFHKQEAE